MRYGLVLVTHGDAPHLAETLQSFERWVTPAPDLRMCVADGPDALLPDVIPSEAAWWIRQHEEQHGFCAAVRTGWQMAREAIEEYRLDFVFWLENDFRFLRPVDVTLMAYALTRFTHIPICQMALMRAAVNKREEKYPNILEAWPEGDPPVSHMGWIQHTKFWTTNPALIPSWVFDVDFPDGPGCEGSFWRAVAPRGWQMGFWGEGDVWVEHMGVRDSNGKGY